MQPGDPRRLHHVQWVAGGAAAQVLPAAICMFFKTLLVYVRANQKGLGCDVRMSFSGVHGSRMLILFFDALGGCMNGTSWRAPTLESCLLFQC